MQIMVQSYTINSDYSSAGKPNKITQDHETEIRKCLEKRTKCFDFSAKREFEEKCVSCQ